MTAMPVLGAAHALSIYQGIDAQGIGAQGIGGGASQAASSGGDFASLLSHSLGDAIDTGRQAETQAVAAIGGGGDLTSVVTAVSRAELALQTTVAVRDRVLQAYQDIIKMPI
jgi:flagellar hook-basal body complex protein FliE